MFSRAAKRRITEQDILIKRLREDLKKACAERDAAKRQAKTQDDRVERFAGDRIKAATGDAREMARLQEVAEAWAELARADQVRAQRILAAAVRFRQRINALQDQLARWEDNDYSVGMPRKASGEPKAQVVELTKTLALRDGTIKRLNEQIELLQAANTAGDFKSDRRGVAASTPLKAAS